MCTLFKVPDICNELYITLYFISFTIPVITQQKEFIKKHVTGKSLAAAIFIKKKKKLTAFLQFLIFIFTKNQH